MNGSATPVAPTARLPLPGKDLIEALTKAAAIVGAALYAAGLIVYTLHLQTFGVGVIGFLSPQYLIAGMWALWFFSAGFLSGWLLWGTIRDGFRTSSPQPGAWRASLGKALFALFAVMLLYGFAAILLLPVYVLTGVTAEGVTMATVLMAGAAGCAAAEARDEWRAGHARNGLLIPVSIVAIALTFFLLFFGRNVFRVIPSRWGGGQPLAATLVPREPAAALHAALGATEPASPGAGLETQVLLLTDTDLVVRDERTQRIHLLRRADLLALSFEPVDTQNRYLNEIKSRFMNPWKFLPFDF